MTLATQNNGYDGEQEETVNTWNFDFGNFQDWNFDSHQLQSQNLAQSYQALSTNSQPFPSILGPEDAREIDNFFTLERNAPVNTSEGSSNAPVNTNQQAPRLVRAQLLIGGSSVAEMVSGSGTAPGGGYGSPGSYDFLDFSTQFPEHASGSEQVDVHAGSDDAAAETLLGMSSTPLSWGALPQPYSSDPNEMQNRMHQTGLPNGPAQVPFNQRPSHEVRPFTYQAHQLDQTQLGQQQYAYGQQQYPYMQNYRPMVRRHTQDFQAYPSFPHHRQQFSHYTAPYSQTRALPTGIPFGSDSNFGQQGYQAPHSSIPHEKAQNLMNVPGVDQATVPARARNYTVDRQRPRGSWQQHVQQRHSLPNNFHPTHGLGIDPDQQLNRPTPSPYQYNPAIQNSAYMSNMQSKFNTESLSKRRLEQAGDGDGDHDHHDNNEAAQQSELSTPAFNNSSQDMHSAKKLKMEGTAVEAQSPYGTPTNPSVRRKSSAYQATDSNNSSPAVQADATNEASSKKKQRKSPRVPLSEDQKRQNHIKSEKQRRDGMKSGYDVLNQYVPALQNGQHGMSRAVVLQKTAEHLETIQAANLAAAELISIDLNDLDLGDLDDDLDEDQAEGAGPNAPAGPGAQRDPPVAK